MLEFGFQRVGDFGQGGRILLRRVAPQSHRHDRHIVDAHRPDQRLADTESGRHEALILEDLVIQPDDRRLPWHTHLILDGEDGDAGSADRVDVLDAIDLGQFLLKRISDQVFDVVHIRTGERHDHVGHGHIDLWLFLARRDQGGGDAEQDRRDRQHRCQRRGLECACDTSGKPQPLTHCESPSLRRASHCAAAAGSVE